MSFALLVIESTCSSFVAQSMYANISPISAETIENQGDIIRVTDKTQDIVLFKGFILGEYTRDEILHKLNLNALYTIEVKGDDNEWAILT